MNARIEWAKTLYKIATENIEFAKKVQMRITYYSTALIMGIYYFKPEDISFDIKKILIFIIFFTCLYIIWKIHIDLIGYRMDISMIRKDYNIIYRYLGDEEPKEDINRYTRITYYPIYPLAYSSIVFICTIITTKIAPFFDWLNILWSICLNYIERPIIFFIIICLILLLLCRNYKKKRKRRENRAVQSAVGENS